MAWLSVNPQADSEELRFGYTSMTTPSSTYQWNMQTKEKQLLKQQEVKGFKHDLYESERIWVKAQDGVEVPVSLVYRKDLFKKGENPILIYGYGSYGSSIDPSFSSARLSLLDRGFVYAIVHVRGGGELGKRWYNQGKWSIKSTPLLTLSTPQNTLLTKVMVHPNMSTRWAVVLVDYLWEPLSIWHLNSTVVLWPRYHL